MSLCTALNGMDGFSMAGVLSGWYARTGKNSITFAMLNIFVDGYDRLADGIVAGLGVGFGLDIGAGIGAGFGDCI